METIAKIRRLHLADRLSIRSITRKTGLSRNTIRKYLRSNEVQPRYRLNSPRPSRCLIEHEVRLRDLYAADSLRSGREQMTMQGFYDILVQEGFEGSYDTVRRYILRLREKTRSGRNRGYIPLAFNAGDALQFDWSCEDVVLGGVECRISVAHFRLCHSRKPFVIAYPRESQEMVLDAFNEAFDFYGGVARRVIIDNPKTMVTHIGNGKERTFHPRFLALMSHYALEPVACTPASGWEKGQVENQVKSLRKQIFSPKLSFDTRDDLNTFLRARCETLANKPHPEDKTRKVCDVFEDERAYLRPVGHPFDGYSEKSVRVSQTCLVQHSTNSYSVPCSYAGEMVFLRAYADRIVISDTHDVIAEHPRSFGRYGKHFCIWHYLPLFQQRPGALRDGAPFKQWKAPISSISHGTFLHLETLPKTARRRP